jgi:hypothetical protein
MWRPCPEGGYLYNFDCWRYSKVDVNPAALLLGVLIIIKGLIFFSAFIYQLLYQLKGHEHFNTSALVHNDLLHFYTSVLHFFCMLFLLWALLLASSTTSSPNS